jgi:hypothetical protein
MENPILLLGARRDAKVPTPEPEKYALPKYPPDFANSIGKRPIKAVDRDCAAVTGARNLSRVLNIRKI